MDIHGQGDCVQKFYGSVLVRMRSGLSCRILEFSKLDTSHKKATLTFHYTGCLNRDPSDGLLKSRYG